MTTVLLLVLGLLTTSPSAVADDGIPWPTTSGSGPAGPDGPAPSPGASSARDATGLIYSTYLGGNGGDDLANDIAVDAAGYAYVVGSTTGADFPATPAAYDQTGNAGNYDAFVAKLSPDGSTLVWATYLGGDASDEVGNAIAVDASGAVYVTGWTQSSDFPTTPGAFNTTLACATSAFVTKIVANGSALAYSTFLCGNVTSTGEGIAVDAVGRAFVTGWSDSVDFPVTGGANDTTYNGGFMDAFVTSFSPDGSSLFYSTFFGGSVDDRGKDVALDASGRAFIVGQTNSGDLPMWGPGWDLVEDGAVDGFLAGFSPDGADQIAGSFVGGSGWDYANSVAVRTIGGATSVAVAGEAGSPLDFPTTPGAYDTAWDNTEGFVLRFDVGPDQLQYSTFIGGGDIDIAWDVAMDEDGYEYVAGQTQSADFPLTADAVDTNYTGPAEEVFVAEISWDGTGLVYGSYLGGDQADRGLGIALGPPSTLRRDAAGGPLALHTIYVDGFTWSADYPTTPGAYDLTLGFHDAFVARIGPRDPLDSPPIDGPPIIILAPPDFKYTNGVLKGNGTPGSPFIIGGRAINGTPGQPGIEIRHRPQPGETVPIELISLQLTGGTIVVVTKEGNASSQMDVDMDNVRSHPNPGGLRGADGSASVGIFLANLTGPSMTNSTVENHTTGIQSVNTTGLTIQRTVVRNGTTGIDLQLSTSGLIENNTVRDAGGYGIVVQAGSDFNQIFHNNFVGNNGGGPQAFDNSNGNQWNAPYPSGGNYWSDHTSPDVKCGPVQDIGCAGDGIVDSPYAIDGGASADMLPLADQSPGVPELANLAGAMVAAVALIATALLVKRSGRRSEKP